MSKKRIFFSLLLSILTCLFLTTCSNQLMRSVTIMYNVDNDDEAHSLHFSIPDGSHLQGNPDAWGDNTWNTSRSTGDYGYTDNRGARHYFFPKGDDGIYTFYYGSSEKKWDTSQPVTSDLFLHPRYETSASSAIAFIQYKKSSASVDRTGRITYTIKDVEYPVEIPSSTNNQYTLDVNSVINSIRSRSSDPVKAQVLDPEVGYGYVDYADNGKRYCLYPSNLALYDEEGNKYEGVCKVNGDITLHFEYENGGYAPISDYFGSDGDSLDTIKSINIPMVFVPGTKDSKGIEHPWPNSHANNFANEYLNIGLGNAEYCPDDIPDYKNHINDMLVMDVPLTQDIVSRIITNSAFQDRFRFYELEPSSAFDTTKGLKWKAGAVGWDYCTVFDCMVMANYLTYLYNEQNRTSAGFTPLSYVYYLPDGTPYFDCTLSNAGNNVSVSVREDSNGFRLLTTNEWEYCAKIITDDRQMPNLSNPIVSAMQPASLHIKNPTSPDGYLYNFQNADEGKQNIYATNPHYSGSGAGLASVKTLSNGLIVYDSDSLRSGASAFGRDANSSARELDLSLLVRLNYEGEMDYNLRNGAGLYNMNAYMHNICQMQYSLYKDSTFNDEYYIVPLCGGDYEKSVSNSAKDLRISALRFLTDSYSGGARFGVRFCRNV